MNITKFEENKIKLYMYLNIHIEKYQKTYQVWVATKI